VLTLEAIYSQKKNLAQGQRTDFSHVKLLLQKENHSSFSIGKENVASEKLWGVVLF